MNTYQQDNTIPIYIILQYGINTLKFPINPETIKKDISSNADTEDIEGIGQVSTPKTPDLAKITIDSFFWQGENYLPSAMYVNWLEKWQKSKKPANLIVTRLNYSMQVTCENFNHWINAGEETDVYFTLDLLEYRPHGAKRLGVKTNPNLLNTLKNIKDLATSPILFEIPRKTRNSTNKQTFTNPYTTVRNETLLSISKKITSSSENWKMLYDENKSELGDIFDSGSIIPEGTQLKLPDDWVSNSSYNIIQETV